MLKTLDQALKILVSFTKEKPEWGARELAKELDLNHTNVYRILSTFEKNQFLVKDPITKKYSLGLPIWELGLIMYDNLSVPQLIRPIMQKLMDQSGESIFLTGLAGDEGLTLDVMEPDNVVKYSVSVGSRAPLYVGASYRSILAFLPDERIQKVISGHLQAYTPTTITDPDELMVELKTIRDQGWARSDGEYTKDVIALAVPLFLPDGKVIASLTVSGPTYRMSEEKIEYCLELLQQAKSEITELINKYKIDFSNYLKASGAFMNKIQVSR